MIVARCAFGEDATKLYSYIIPPYLEDKLEPGDWIAVIGPKKNLICLEVSDVAEFDGSCPEGKLKTVVDKIELQRYAEHMGA